MATYKQPQPAPQKAVLPSYIKGGNAKTTGIKIRGTGAQTKGTIARGPMA